MALFKYLSERAAHQHMHLQKDALRGRSAKKSDAPA
jgi:hypothetical protein